MSQPQMKRSRRDIFKFAGGAVAGALFTPAPWRLITDTALWSENWPGIPRPARGEIRAKFTNCSLCPAGCAVRARCVGEQPVSLAGVRGGLCPFGLTAHHLPYHPARLKQGPIEEATRAVAQRAAEGIAILDLNPGRTASWTYRRAMASLKGIYLAPESPAEAYDLSAAKTVLSIGAPLLDGWGTPANVIAARQNFRLIQAEAVESRTAVLADEWIPLDAGHRESVRAADPEVASGGTHFRAGRRTRRQRTFAGDRRCARDSRNQPTAGRLGKDGRGRDRSAGTRLLEEERRRHHRARRRARPFHTRAADRRIGRRKLYPVAPDRAETVARESVGGDLRRDARRLRAPRAIRTARRCLSRVDGRHRARGGFRPPGFPDFGSAGDAARRPGESGGFRRRARWSTSLQLTPRTRRRYPQGRPRFGTHVRRRQRDSGEGTHRRCLLEGLERRRRMEG